MRPCSLRPNHRLFEAPRTVFKPRQPLRAKPCYMTTHITLLCALSGAIYRTGFQAALEGYGCGLLRALPKGEGAFRSHYAIVRKGQDLIVVFRGTNSIQDWVTNMDSGPARVSDNLHAHKGYWAAVSSAMHPLLVSLNNEAIPGQHVYFTGHSKGGGEAILAYLWWTTNSAHVANGFPNLRGAKVMVVTFGAPLVVMVDDEARPPRQLDGPVVNYVDHLDLVPKCLARRATWKIRDSYMESIDLLPTFVSAARSAWLAATNPAQLINGKLKLETLYRSSQSVRDAIVYAIAFHLERLRGKGPQYVPAGRFVELSPKGAREISAEKLMAKASAPARLSVEGVWEMIMHHYPARYAEGVGRAQN